MPNVHSLVRRQYPQGHQSGPNEWRTDCPSCRGADTLSINMRTGTHICYRCNFGRRRRPSTLLGPDFEQDAPEISPDLRSRFNAMMDIRRGGEAPALEEAVLPSEYKALTDGEGIVADVAREYLFNRRISVSDIVEFGLGYCSVGKYRWRVVLPVYDFDMLATWQARALDREMEPRYLNPVDAGAKRAGVMFNYEPSRPWSIFVEGQFDAYGLRALGYRGATGLFNLAMSDAQFHRIACAPPEEATVMLDPHAEVEALAIAERLAGVCPKVTVAWLLGGDPSDAPELAVHSALEHREPYTRTGAIRKRLQLLA